MPVFQTYYSVEYRGKADLEGGKNEQLNCGGKKKRQLSQNFGSERNIRNHLIFWSHFTKENENLP